MRTKYILSVQVLLTLSAELTELTESRIKDKCGKWRCQPDDHKCTCRLWAEERAIFKG